jgi:hypothetical protein
MVAVVVTPAFISLDPVTVDLDRLYPEVGRTPERKDPHGN